MEIRAYIVPDYVRIADDLERDRLRWLTVPEVLPHTEGLEGLQIVTGTIAIYWGFSGPLGYVLATDTYALLTNKFNPFPHFVEHDEKQDEYLLRVIGPGSLMGKGVVLDYLSRWHYALSQEGEGLDISQIPEEISNLLGIGSTPVKIKSIASTYHALMTQKLGAFTRPVILIPGDPLIIDFGNKPEGTFYIPVEERRPSGLFGSFPKIL